MRVEPSRRILPALGLFVVSTLLATQRVAAALPNQWTAIGPYAPGGSVHAVVPDRANAGTIYIGTDGGVFKSVDGGASWGAVNFGLTGFSVSALVPDPLAPGTLYAGTNVGVFKTFNGGSEWLPQRTGLGAIAVAALAVDPASPQVLYAGTTSGGVFRSTDGAATWTASSNGLGSADVRAVVVAPASAPRTVWAATAAGVSISSDGGSTWSLAPGFSRPVRALAVDPATPSTLYAGTDEPLSPGGIFKSTDGGHTWISSGSGLGSIAILSIAVSPTATSTVFAGTQGAGVFVTRDAGVSWSPLGGSPATTQAIALDPSGATPTVWAGAPDGLSMSPDGGVAWQVKTGSFSTLTVNALLFDPASTSVVYAAVTRPGGTGGGVFKSADGGATWAFIGGLPDNRVMTLAATGGSSPAILAGTNGAGIFRTRDAGATWSTANSGITTANVNVIVAAGGAVLYAASDSGIFRSADGGDTWTPTQNALPNWSVQSVAVDPGSSSVVYAGTSSGVYKTTDSGASWSAANAGLPNVRILSLVIDPTTPQTIYAGTIAPFSAGAPQGMGVYRSTDGGLNWSPANAGIESSVVGSLATDPLGAVVYAGTTSGVYRLARGASSWTALNQGIADQAVDAILVDRQAPSVLYAGTALNSVFKANVSSVSGSCVAGPRTLCLNANRFQVEVAWQAPLNDWAGDGMAVPLTSDTGAFWFFTSGNIELVVKAVDGRAFNGAYWVFYGAMSDVDYTVTVTDTQTGQKRTYHNPQGQLASVADTSAFPGAASGASAASASSASTSPFVPSTSLAATGACVADATTLCLNGGRFRVQVDWVAALIGQSGHGQAAPLSSDSGSFWFFSPGNLELNLKVVDGRAVNSRYWVFYGALSDVAYTITVTDTVTGAQRIYTNPQGRLASVADTNAF